MENVYELQNKIWFIMIFCGSVILAAVYIYKNCDVGNCVHNRILNIRDISLSSCDEKNSEVDSQASTVVV